jgi:hypothetical protein
MDYRGLVAPTLRDAFSDTHSGGMMTPVEYRAALSILGLSQQAAGRWLMVSPKTAQNYAKLGPSGPAAVAIRMALQHGLTR